ncbi:apolipoprotein N-acyltransferase [Eubacteriales bacterium OttesenSCG-928-G02]|nr:apolipoprotein N-acyltransferase [Eubacteriales bacterium OttesenSCG-928-G02]
MKNINIFLAKIYKHQNLWCFLSGIIYSFSFLNGYLFFFAFIGLILFFYRLFTDSALNKIFRTSIFFFLGFYLILYTWFIELYPFEGFNLTKTQGIVIVISAVLGISIIHSLEAALIFKLSKLFKSYTALLPIGFAFLFILSEWFMSLGDLGFSWGTMAVSQYRFLPLLQNASLFGSYFITFLIAACCGYFSLFLLHKKINILKIASALLIAPILSGGILLLIPQNEEKTLSAAIIQGNILSMEKWEEDRYDIIFNRYLDLTTTAAKNGSELIVLPESAIPAVFKENSLLHNTYADIAKTYNCSIIMGVLRENGDYKCNSIVLITPDGKISNFYDKQHLVPFGEFIPYKTVFNNILSFFSNMNLGNNEYTAGNSSSLFDYYGSKIGSLVCFDSIFGSSCRNSVRDGAELIAVCTNDSWYKDSPGVYQHLAHSVVRAVENGRTIVRSANTGISCFISPKGKITQETEPLVVDVVYSDVSLSNHKTLYYYVGDVPLYLTFVFILVFIFINIFNFINTKGAYNGRN